MRLILFSVYIILLGSKLSIGSRLTCYADSSLPPTRTPLFTRSLLFIFILSQGPFSKKSFCLSHVTVFVRLVQFLLLFFSSASAAHNGIVSQSCLIGSQAVRQACSFPRGHSLTHSLTHCGVIFAHFRGSQTLFWMMQD